MYLQSMYHLSIGTPMMISSMAIFESYEDALRDQTEAADVRRNDPGAGTALEQEQQAPWEEPTPTW